MSNKWLNHVWQSNRQKGASRLVLLAIADHANDDGECWPSVARLAQYACVSERQCQRLIAQLEADGEIVVKRGSDGKSTSRYLIRGDIAMSPVTQLRHQGGDTAMSPGGVTQLRHQGGDIAMSPEPPYNPQVEPSVKPAATPVPALPESPTDRDGRATVQAVSDAGWLITQPERAIAANLEAQYELRDILAAVTMLTDRQRVLLGKGQRGIAKPIAYLATILQETPAKPAAKPAAQYYITDPVTNERTLVQL